MKDDLVVRGCFPYRWAGDRASSGGVRFYGGSLSPCLRWGAEHSTVDLLRPRARDALTSKRAQGCPLDGDACCQREPGHRKITGDSRGIVGVLRRRVSLRLRDRGLGTQRWRDGYPPTWKP